MRTRTRHVIAVMVVATALCADRRTAPAAPAARPASAGLARTFAARLARTLGQQANPAVAIQPARIDAPVRTVTPVIPDAPSGVHRLQSPFQLRLPPPAL
jgi:hypothetical protein